MGMSVKAKMFSHKKVVEADGPTLLWILLKTYQGTPSQVICSMMRKLDTLSNNILTYKYNIKKFF